MEDDLRSQVRASVARRQPVDEHEKTSIQRFLVDLDRLDHPFTEGADITHVTGSSIVIGPRGLLLHLHKRAQIWLQPGGHIDHGELPWEGAVRETWEETGIAAVHPNGQPRLIHVDAHEAPKGHFHLDLRYLLIGPDADPAPPAGESQQVRWYPWEEALAIDRISLQGAIRAALPEARQRGWVA